LHRQGRSGHLTAMLTRLDIMRRAFVIALLLTQVLAACQLGLGAGRPGAGTDTIVGDAIEVTSLDAPVVSGADAASAALQTAIPVGAALRAGPPAEAGDDGQIVSADPAAEAYATPQATPAPAKSKAWIACERGGGQYARAGESGARTCIKPTRDGGKQCRRQTDCDGVCLARSNSCAPVAPLFGCNDILQADGRRVTLCID